MEKNELVTQGALESAMHMVDGLATHDSFTKVLELHGNCEALFKALMPYAVFADKLYQKGFEELGSGPGVFDYEVSWEFGRWFGDKLLENVGAEPRKDVAFTKLQSLDDGFWIKLHPKNEQPSIIHIVGFVTFGGVGGHNWFWDSRSANNHFFSVQEDEAVQSGFLAEMDISHVSAGGDVDGLISDLFGELEETAILTFQRKSKDTEDPFAFRCPKCRDPHNLSLVVINYAKMVQKAPGNFETDVDTGSHEWNDNSDMWCDSCPWTGTVGQAKVENQWAK